MQKVRFSCYINDLLCFSSSSIFFIYVKEGEIIDDFQYACVYDDSEDTKYFFLQNSFEGTSHASTAVAAEIKKIFYRFLILLFNVCK